MDLASSLLTVTIMKSWKLLPLAHPCGQSWLNKNIQQKFWKKIGSPFSGCMIHHNSISGGSCFFFFKVQDLPENEWRRYFVRNYTSFQRLQTGAMGNCGKKACFCFCCFILVTNWFRFWPSHDCSTVMCQSNRQWGNRRIGLCMCQKHMTHQCRLILLPARMFPCGTGCFFCYVIINHLKRQRHESCSVLVKTRPCSH